MKCVDTEYLSPFLRNRASLGAKAQISVLKAYSEVCAVQYPSSGILSVALKQRGRCRESEARVFCGCVLKQALPVEHVERKRWIGDL